jgi:hypothetical protein
MMLGVILDTGFSAHPKDFATVAGVWYMAQILARYAV